MLCMQLLNRVESWDVHWFVVMWLFHYFSISLSENKVLSWTSSNITEILPYFKMASIYEPAYSNNCGMTIV